MVSRPKPSTAFGPGQTRPGELYMPGDKLPEPEVTETNTDSVWALWSDLVSGEEQAPPQRDDADQGPDTHPATLIMDLPDLPKDPDA